jgi:hypothetical protein
VFQSVICSVFKEENLFINENITHIKKLVLLLLFLFCSPFSWPLIIRAVLEPIL